jgi:hypothetical protein
MGFPRVLVLVRLRRWWWGVATPLDGSNCVSNFRQLEEVPMTISAYTAAHLSLLDSPDGLGGL